MTTPIQDWRSGVAGELEFWRLFRSFHPVLFARGMDPDAPLDLDVDCAVLKDGARILDLGCGMVSSMGRRSRSGRTVEIHYADALAPEFYAIAKLQGFVLPYRIEEAHAESLEAVYSPGLFDVIYCRNALDHCYNPVEALRLLPRFLADNGTLVLKHYRNCADLNDWSGLHKWNFYDRGGQLWLDRCGDWWCVDKLLSSCHKVAVRRYTEEWGTAILDMVCAIYRKETGNES